jgi:uncharacterized cupredoxin-like copper-binding protein
MTASVTRAIRILMLAVAVPLVLANCGTSGSDAGRGKEHGDGPHGDAHGDAAGKSFGVPGEPREADATIRVAALDSLEFDPGDVRVLTGDTVTFIVKNAGQNPHEFVLGDEAAQEDHAAMEHGDMGMGDGGIEVAPGATKRLTWRFDESGEVQYGCHEPGHYKGGMVGTITVVDA